MLQKILLIIVGLCLILNKVSSFTCQGTSYSAALSNCPDSGSQQMSSGGNVTVKVIRATNLPNKDNSGPASKVSDPFVRFQTSTLTRDSKVIRNNLNPVWNEDVNLGFLGSATELTVEIWDKDSGLEFSDDLLVRSTIRVPFCSYFNSSSSTIDCGTPFNCMSEDSLWQMPTRHTCSESGYINFNSKISCSQSNSVCLYLEFTLVPYVMSVDLVYSNNIIKTPVLSVAGPTSKYSWSKTFGYPFLSSSVTLDTAATVSKSLKGALMLQMLNSEKSYSSANALKFYASVNFPSLIYVCRFSDDNDKGLPTWISNNYDSTYSIARQLLISSTSDYFPCYLQEVSGTKKNRWGGILSGAIPFYSNTISGHDKNTVTDQGYYKYNYVVLAVPIVDSPRDDTLIQHYDASKFTSFLGSYGLICLWFIYLSFRFLNKIDYRIDRVSNYVVMRVLTGKDRNLLGAFSLFQKASESNVYYRAYLYHASNAIYFILLIPFGLLFSWGISCAVVVRPYSLGVAVTLIGYSALFFYFGTNLWKRSNWRFSSIALLSLILSFGSFLLFLLISLFLDPNVLQMNQHIDFTALSLIFGTVNCIPCLLLIFKQDRSHKVFMGLVISKISEAVMELKTQGVKSALNYIPNAQNQQINRILHALLGESYTMNPKIPALKFSAVMSEVQQSYNNSITTAQAVTMIPTPSIKTITVTAKEDPSHDDLDEEEINQELLSEERRLYGVALIILFVYLVFALSRTQAGSLAFLNICTLIFLDFIHISLSKGENDWSPGFKVTLLILGRLLICGSPVSLWILNYSTCFLLYSITLIYELINSILPKLTQRKAGEIVFGSSSYQQSIKESLKSNDLSGSILFNLCFLIISFIAILIISANMSSHSLLVPDLRVLGMPGWPIYIFGLIAFLVAIIAGLFMATYRIYELNKNDLLSSSIKEIYLIRKDIGLPSVLAISTECSILLSGLLIFAITNSLAVLVGCIFLPFIFLTLGNAMFIWMKNDYELVIWPRKNDSDENKKDKMSLRNSITNAVKSLGTKDTNKNGGNGFEDDLERAFDLVENLFGNDKPIAHYDPNGGELEDLEEEHPEENGPESSQSINVDLESSTKLILPNEKTLKGFTLPPLKSSATASLEHSQSLALIEPSSNQSNAIKMPPLPLKSVLRRKRQNMNIKTQNLNSTNITTDLRIADRTASSKNNAAIDAFGIRTSAKLNTVSSKNNNNKNEFFDINDPWSQFEQHEEEHKKKPKVSTVVRKERVEYNSLRRLRIWMKNSTVIQSFYMCFKSAYNYVRRSMRVHPNVYKPTLDDEEEAVDGQAIDLNDPLNRTISPKKKKLKSDSDLDHQEDDIDLSKMPFWEAFWSGFLTQQEYQAVLSWFGGLFLIMMFGISLSLTIQPYYFGFILWIVMWLLLFFFIPIFKYFQTYIFDQSSKTMIKYGFLVHFLFCVSFFGAYLKGDLGLVGSLWIVDFFFYYPIFVYIIFVTAKWVDSNFKLSIIDSNNDNKISLKEIIQALQTTPALFVMIIFFNWQLYVWINTTVGLVFTLVLILSGLIYLYIKDWVMNDYYLSTEMIGIGSWCINLTLFISFCVALFRNTSSPIFAISVFIYVLAFKYSMYILNRYINIEKDSIFFFSPYLFPVYSYNISNQDLLDESELVYYCIIVFVCGVLWGACMIIFYSPVNIGMALACGFLLVITAIAAICISYVPRRLAKSNGMIQNENIIEAANCAKEKFQERRTPLNLEIPAYSSDNQITNYDDLYNETEDIAGGVMNILGGQKTILDLLKEKTALETSLAIMADYRHLKYVRADSVPSLAPQALEEGNASGKELISGKETLDLPEDEQDEYELSFWESIVKNIKDFFRELYELLPIHPQAGYVRHKEAPFNINNAFLEVFFMGRGPFGLFGLGGLICSQLKKLKGDKYMKWIYPKWTEHYDEFGNNFYHYQLSEPLDYPNIMSRILDLDRALDYSCKEESRCAIHFLVMLLVTADAKLQREQVLFQKFLRENRFKLASNGISPPKNVFTSASYASINIPLVAIWLNTLSKEERERFYILKDTFNKEQAALDNQIDEADYQLMYLSNKLKKQRQLRDNEYASYLFLEIIKRKETKLQAFIDSLEGYEKTKFLARKDLWLNDPECFVDLKETSLYDRFKNICLREHQEDFREYAMNYLLDCETAQRDIRLGEYGRQYQFVDSEFPPSELSIQNSNLLYQITDEEMKYNPNGSSDFNSVFPSSLNEDIDLNAYILGWRCAPGIVENIQIFENGTHPNDVCEGVFNDNWLLSAISMIVAAGNYGNGLINDQIKSLFILHPTSANDGELTMATEVGAYGLQLFRNSDWVPVMVDDLLPIRNKEQWTNENRGMACAHCRECRGLWVQLIEKAYAKYLGSYQQLKFGFVEHALEDLTGCEAECLPLSNFSRGVGRLALWDRLVQYKRNGYILGAGTGASHLVDKEILEMGIMFNSAYTIYDVLVVDNLHLIKLRNPPGDHDEWKGDWSDHSKLWTKRLKYKMNYKENDQDNTFYISFDDFLNVFRYLYVCKYYHPKKWIENRWNGYWKKSNEAVIEQMDLMHQFFLEQREHMVNKEDLPEIDTEALNKKKAKARLDSAGGLPTRHNPGCILENNPYYSLHLNRPTDIKITVTQITGRGMKTLKVLENPLPFSIFLLKCDQNGPQRKTTLLKEDILYSTGIPQPEKTLNLYINNLLPGSYTILVATYLAGMEGHFNISILSNYRCDFTPLWPPAWMLKDDLKDSTGGASVTDAFEDKVRTRLLKSSTEAQKGMQSASKYFRKGLKSLFGQEDNFADDDDDGDDHDKTKNKGEDSDEDSDEEKAKHDMV